MIPRLYIRDVNDKTIATLDEGDYFDDTLTRYLAGKSSVFEFSIYKKDGDYQLFSAGKKISFRHEGEDFWLNVMMVEQDETTLTITAVSLNLELNNETVGAYSGTSKSFVDYFNAMINFEQSLTIGINEVADKKISNEWTGTSTLLARLFSLATVFSAEVEFVTELADNGSLKNIVVNVYKEHSDTNQGLGVNRTSETFRFGSEITTVKKSEDISDIYTAILPKGTDGLTIKDVEHEVLDEMGNILYCTYKTAKPEYPDVNKIYAPQSRELFPSTLAGSDRWIVSSTDELQYTSAEALYGYALGQLKQYSVPQTKWEISGYITARIGDTIRVADDGYKPEIYLNARITEQSISFTDPSKNKSTFSNVVELKSEVNADLLKIAEQLKKEINYVLSTVVDYHASDQGATVPTGDWLADLPTTQPGEWLWTRTTQSMSNGTSVVSFGKSYNGVDGGDGVSPEITVNPDTSLTIADKDGEKTTPILKGDDGKTSYIHTAWSWSKDGTDRFTTVYPNENILVNSKDYSSKWAFNNAALTEILEADGTPTKIIKFNYNPNGWVGVYQTATVGSWNKRPKSGDTVTLSFYARGNGRIYSTIDGVTGAINQNATNEWNKYSLSGIATKDVGNVSIYFHNILTSATSIFIHSVKFEINGEPTIYTPSPQDDPINAYPEKEGTYSDFNAEGSDNPDDYVWKPFRGVPGKDGYTPVKGVDYFDGAPGQNGKSSRLWIKYSQKADGNPMTDDPTNAVYTGYATTLTDTAPTDYKAYKWQQTRGKDGEGIPGEPGADGLTSYLHIKYSNDGGKTFTGNSGEDVGAWIGQYVDFTKTDSAEVADYTWNKVAGDDGISPEITVNPDTSLAITDKNGTQTTPKLRGPKGDQGIMGVAYAQPTAPTTTQAGATWFKTKSATDNSVIGIYTLIGTTWTETPVTADALAVTSLSAISANLGTVNAGTINGITINGSEFVNTFDRETVEGGPYIKGTTTIGEGRYRVEYQTYTKSTGVVLSKGRTFIDESGQVTSRLEDPSGNALYTASVGPSGMQLNNYETGLSSNIVAGTVYDTGWVELSSTCKYRAKNGVMQLYINLPAPIATGAIATLPIKYAPSYGCMSDIPCWSLDINARARLQVNAKNVENPGLIQIVAVGATAYQLTGFSTPFVID